MAFKNLEGVVTGSPPRIPATLDEEYELIPPELWVSFNIPATDIFDAPHPEISLNGKSWGPGAHKAPPAVAKEVLERLDLFTNQSIRVLQPKKDLKARDALKTRGYNPTQNLPN